MVTAVAAVIPEGAHTATVGILLQFDWLNGGDISGKRRNPRATGESRDEHEEKNATKRHDVFEVSRTTQAQRPGTRDATMATTTFPPGSLQRMVRRRHFGIH
jgi:hypothetical protein